MKRLGGSILSAVLLIISGCTNPDNCAEHHAAVNGQAYPKPEGYSPRRPLTFIQPHMPDRATQGLKEGLVDVAFTLQPDGSVSDIRVIREAPEQIGFADAVLKVFGGWRFPPKLVDGKPVSTEAVYRVTFKIMIQGPLYSYCPY